MKRKACGLWRHWPGTVWFIWSSFPAGSGLLFLGRDGGKDGSVRVDSFLEEAIVRDCSYSKQKLPKPCLGFRILDKGLRLKHNMWFGGMRHCLPGVQPEPCWPTHQGHAHPKGSNWSAPHCGLFLTCLGLASASQSSKVFLLKMSSCWGNNP